MHTIIQGPTMQRPSRSASTSPDPEALSMEQLQTVNGGLFADFQNFKINPVTIKYVLPRIRFGNINVIGF